MRRYVAVLLGVLALVLAVRSDEKLKCHMCTSLTDDGCKDPNAHNLEPVDCTFEQMDKLQRNSKQHNVLAPISGIFEVDNLQHYHVNAPMACAKLVLKVVGQEVTVRSCQTAKTETIDPCKAINSKLNNNNMINVEFCDLCTQDGCNGSSIPVPRFLAVFLAVMATMAVVRRVA